MATPNRRGFFSSFQYVTLVGGQILALGIQLVLQNVLSEHDLQQWGWRIPFAIGALLSVVAFYIRSRLNETEQFNDLKNNRATTKHPIRELFRYPKEILQVVGLTLGGTLAFYTYTTYMQKFLVNTIGISKQLSTLLSFLSLLVFAVLQPLFGALSDRIGRKPLLIGFGVAGTIATVPLFIVMSRVTSPAGILLLMIIPLMIVSGYTSINAIVKAELFPTKIRALGVGLPYSVTVAVFGGSAEFVALSFKQAGHEEYYYYYVTIAIFVSLIVYTLMPDTKDKSQIEQLTSAPEASHTT
jgi:MHS family alpha-ketoglutarate permease-like MFS transporter